MLNSLAKYSRNFFLSLFKGDARKVVGKDLFSPLGSHQFTIAEKNEAIEKAVNWLVRAQDRMNDDGFGSYHLINDWTTSYPETSGYIIPTLLTYAAKTGNEDLKERCKQCADWLLSIQKESGGWQSMTISHERPEVVFNTGQVLRGLHAVYLETADVRYLKACEKAIEWLCSVQEDDGAWRKNAFMEVERVYDSYVDAPILDVNRSLGNRDFREAAISNLDWIVTQKQRNNGWFSDCDNTLHKNDRPILHTIAYTIDGLIDSAIYTGDQKYFNAAVKPAAALLEIFTRKGQLPGRFNEQWEGSEHTILTGCAQISICWMKIYRKSGEAKFMDGARNMNQFLLNAQQRTDKGSENIRGALSGSYPVWGRYENFAFPNWATKYLVDALLLELEIDSKH